MDRIILHIPYFQAPNTIFELALSTNEKIALLYLCRCANNASSAFPSYSTIGKKCSISRSTAIRTVNSLLEKGYLVKHTRPKKNGDNESNIYEIMFPSVTQTPPPSVRGTPPSVTVTPYKEPCINDHNDDDIAKKLSTRKAELNAFREEIRCTTSQLRKPPR